MGHRPHIHNIKIKKVITENESKKEAIVKSAAREQNKCSKAGA